MRAFVLYYSLYYILKLLHWLYFDSNWASIWYLYDSCIVRVWFSYEFCIYISRIILVWFLCGFFSRSLSLVTLWLKFHLYIIFQTVTLVTAYLSNFQIFFFITFVQQSVLSFMLTVVISWLIFLFFLSLHFTLVRLYIKEFFRFPTLFPVSILLYSEMRSLFLNISVWY